MTPPRPIPNPTRAEPPDSTLTVPEPSGEMEWTGERFVSRLGGEIRLEHHHRYLVAATLCAGLDVLDIASGEGFGSALLATVARSVVGVDRDPDAVAFAARAYADAGKGLRFEAGECAAIPLPDASVDAVVSFETIEHIGEHDRFLAEVRRVMRPGGVFICSTPDRDVYRSGSDPNTFHVKELNTDEFSGLLARHFGHVEMLGQRVLAGSWLLPRAPGNAGAPLEIFSTVDGRSYGRSVGMPDPVYLLAVCADAKIPALHPSALVHEQLRPREIERLGMALRDERNAAAKALSESRTSAALLRRQTQQLQQRCDDLLKQAEAADRAVADARAAAEAAMAETARLEDKLRSERQQASQLEKQSNDQREAARRELAQTRRSLELAVEREKRLLAQRDEARARIREAEREHDRSEQALELALDRERTLLGQRDEARGHADEYAQELGQAAERERGLLEQLKETQGRAHRAEQSIRTLEASRSWRWTAPLRYMRRMLGGKAHASAGP